MDRKRIMELVDQRMAIASQPRPKREQIQRTGKQTLQFLLSDDLAIGQELKKDIRPKIILYLRDGLNPADKNFTKTPNEMYNLTAERLTPYETVLYMWVWRISWGYGNNYCRFSRKDARDYTSLNSESTIRRAIAGLREKRFIILALDKEDNPVVGKEGSLYRVCTPAEILKGKVEEGIPLAEIPVEGVFCESRVAGNQVDKPNKLKDVQMGVSQSRVTENRVPTEPGLKEPSSRFPQSRVTENQEPANLATEPFHAEGVPTEPGHREPPLKDRDNLKDSLSPRAIISGFYRGIGQSKISKEKRERAEKNLKELLDDGFSPTDIQLAIEWTLRNSKEELYDFSIIKHTIGQAMAARKKVEEEKAKKLEEERREAQQAAEEKGRAEEEVQIKAYKESLDAGERAELRKRAEAEIRSSGQFKEEFITDFLIEIKENSLIRERLGIKPLE